jgi:hypothetical protein
MNRRAVSDCPQAPRRIAPSQKALTGANAGLGWIGSAPPSLLVLLREGEEVQSDLRLPSRASFQFDAPTNPDSAPPNTSFGAYRSF